MNVQREKIRKKDKYISRIIMFINILLFITILTIILPYQLFGIDTINYKGAGQPSEVNDYITVENKQEKPQFHFTYVNYYQPYSLFDVVLLKWKERFSPYPINKIESKQEQLIPSYMSDEEYQNYIQSITNEGFQTPIYLAYQKVGKELDILYHGGLVQYIDNQDNIKKELQVGDIIQSVENYKFTTAEDMSHYLQSFDNNTIVDITVLRNDKEITVSHKLRKIEGKIMLGVILSDYYNYDIPKDIEYDIKNLSGDSAGLIFTLYLIDILNGDKNLDKGYNIAGSGSVDMEGNVHQIGGIEYKVAGAIEDDMDIFFVPKDINNGDTNQLIAENVQQSSESDMKIVPVATVDEALEYLNNLK